MNWVAFGVLKLSQKQNSKAMGLSGMGLEGALKKEQAQEMVCSHEEAPLSQPLGPY